MTTTLPQQAEADRETFCQYYNLSSPTYGFGKLCAWVNFTHDPKSPLWRPDRSIVVRLTWTGGQTAFTALNPGADNRVSAFFRLTPEQIAQLDDNVIRASVTFAPVIASAP